MKKTTIILWTLFFIFLFVGPTWAQEAWQLSFTGEVTPSQVTWLENAYEEAEEAGVSTMLMVLDTPGGRIDSALEIAKIIQSRPTIILVEGGAISAGAYMALSADRYYMLEGTTIGAAEPRLGNEVADEKTVSFWSGQLATMAEKNGRNPSYARAMADKDLVIEGYSEKGKLLTLTAREALELEMTDGVYADKASFLADQDIQVVRSLEKDTMTRLADFLTSSVVSTLLLTLGLAGIVLELFVPGFGLPGIVGLSSLALYFGGSILAGISGWEAALLFIVGLILIAVEVFFIPGFGVAGVGGFIAIFASVFVATPDPTTAIRTIVIALLASVVLIILLARILPTRRYFSKIILRKETDTDSGYVSFSSEMNALKGKSGKAYTALRPSGTARIEEAFVDVITQGEYIKQDAEITVVDVVGGRVIVEEKKEDK